MPNYEWPLPLTLDKLHSILSTHPAFSNKVVALTAATITLTPEKHADRVLMFDSAAGVTVTLPKATGSGHTYEFLIKTLPTSNSLIVKVGNTTDIMQGYAVTLQDGGNTALLFETAADSDTITFDRSTTGGTQKGEKIVLRDLDSGVWSVEVHNIATGTEATCFSATVS